MRSPAQIQQKRKTPLLFSALGEANMEFPEYIARIENIDQELTDLIISLEDKTLLQPEKQDLEKSRTELRRALTSFKRLKGIQRR